MGLFDFWKKRKKKAAAAAAAEAAATADLSGVDPAEIVPPETRYTQDYKDYLASREAEGSETGKRKALVAYFSAGGVTAGVAKRLADAAGTAIYEIRPAVPYTEEDLDWRNQNSRSSLEMKDKSSRPALADTDAPVAEAGLIFLGYPVWWYREPSIIDTFLEAYDFKGKRIVLFATSGVSGIGDEAPARAAELTGAEVLPGKRFPADVSGDELKAWAEEY